MALVKYYNDNGNGRFVYTVVIDGKEKIINTEGEENKNNFKQYLDKGQVAQYAGTNPPKENIVQTKLDDYIIPEDNPKKRNRHMYDLGEIEVIGKKEKKEKKEEKEEKTQTPTKPKLIKEEIPWSKLDVSKESNNWRSSTYGGVGIPAMNVASGLTAKLLKDALLRKTLEEKYGKENVDSNTYSRPMNGKELLDAVKQLAMQADIEKTMAETKDIGLRDARERFKASQNAKSGADLLKALLRLGGAVPGEEGQDLASRFKSDIKK